ncbi:efflux transporter outer membrane subunit [Stenotrophomonas maltophilia]|uniref:efflux transporter outer membrane subunit n=1 Tax=Stenotrophomonas TaxID=40323 RepID=UPI0018D4CC28|nr:efflux transporter outer membrane subunit [Stenotrophomonas maltophilia]MBH1747441.1 efflux transporter outer membrane subunit [Stenotrophomonas maltophilia]
MAALAGCSLSPKYVRPAAVVPEQLGSTTVSPTNGARCSELMRGEDIGFVRATVKGGQLDAMIKAALCRSPDYRLAELNVRLARAQAGQSNSARLPRLDGQIVKSKQRFGDSALDERYQQDLSMATVGLSEFDPDFFGRLRSLAAAEGLRWEASQHGRDAARGALIGETLRAYVLYSAAKEAEAQAGVVASSTREQLRLAERRQALGMIASDDLRDAESLAAQADANAAKAAEASKAQERALRFLVGFDSALPSPNLSLFVDGSGDAARYGGLDSSVLYQRPEVLEAEAQLQAAHADIGAARAAFFPSIQLTTSLGSASESLGGLFSASKAWTFTPSLRLPIFDFGRNKQALNLAWIRQQQGVVQYEKAVQRAFVDVADALGSRSQAEQAYTAVRRKELAAVGKTGRLIQRIDAGLQDAMDRPHAEIDAANATADRVAAQQDFALSRIALSHAFYATAPARPSPSDSH